jgi:hypothetical protein
MKVRMLIRRAMKNDCMTGTRCLDCPYIQFNLFSAMIRSAILAIELRTLPVKEQKNKSTFSCSCMLLLLCFFLLFIIVVSNSFPPFYLGPKSECAKQINTLTGAVERFDDIEDEVRSDEFELTSSQRLHSQNKKVSGISYRSTLHTRHRAYQ